VEAVSLRFDQRLSGYVVSLLTRQEVRERIDQRAETQKDAELAREEEKTLLEQINALQPGNDEERQKLDELRRAAANKYRRVMGTQQHRYFDIAEIGADYVTLTAIVPDDTSIILPISRIAYLVPAEQNADVGDGAERLNLRNRVDIASTQRLKSELKPRPRDRNENDD
jgi:hypothetical protein